MNLFRLPQPLYEQPGAGTGAGDNPGAPPTPAPAPAAPTMPAGLPEQYWDADANSVKMTELVGSYNELTQFKTDADAKAALVPQTEDAYTFTLPETVNIPEGIDLKYDDKRPELVEARKMAKEMGLSQEQFSSLLALDARMKIADWNKAQEEVAAEKTKLGENFETRHAALNSFLQANLSGEEFEAMQIVVADAHAFSAVEKLMQKATDAGVPNSGVPPENRQPARPQTMAERFYPQGDI